MNLVELYKLVKSAKQTKPPHELLDYCGPYYQPYYHFMYLAARQVRDLGWCVELGSETGRGLTALGLSDALSVGFDNQDNPQIYKVAKKYPNVLFFHRPSLPVWDKFFEQKTIGLLHIDTEHSYAMASEEFKAYKPYLVDGSIVIFDDLHAQEDDVLKFFKELPYDKIQDDDMHPTCGWGVMRYTEGL